MITPFSDEWYERAIELDDSLDGPVEAGLIPHQFEKVIDLVASSRMRHLAPLTFYYFVHYSRRKHGLSVNDLSKQTNIGFEELMALERDTQYKLKLESVIRLAKYFNVDEYGLIKMARLDKPRRDPSWEKPAVQFPDEVGSIEPLDELALMVLMAIEDFLAKHAQKVNLEFAA